jgi:hypothetical protein
MPIIPRAPKLAVRKYVGPYGDFKTLKEAVDWFNASATACTEILLDGCDHDIADTVTVNNGSYDLQIRGLGSAVTYLKAASGLTDKPMFNLKTNCDLNKFTATGSTLTTPTVYGTRAGENFITFDTNMETYHEITDFFADTFKIGIADLIGKEIFLFNYVISSCAVGTQINYSGTPAGIVTLDVEVGNFESCPIGIDLLQATKSNFILNHLVFIHDNGSDIGIKYTGGAFVYQTISNILNCTYNYVGSLISGFDFERTDGRDANIIIKGNVGIEDKVPHAKLNIVDNTTITTLTTQNVYYKAQGINSKTNVKCDAAATGGTFTLTIGAETTGAINYSATPLTMQNNIRTAVEALTAVTTVTVTTVVNATEWNIEFITVSEGFVRPHSATNSLTSVTSITVTPSFYVNKVKCLEDRMTLLSGYPIDGVMWICGNIISSKTGDVVNVALKKNNAKIMCPFSVRCTTSTQPYAFSMVVYLDNITLNDYFEIFLSDATSSNETAILSDMTWYFSAR